LAAREVAKLAQLILALQVAAGDARVDCGFHAPRPPGFLSALLARLRALPRRIARQSRNRLLDVSHEISRRMARRLIASVPSSSIDYNRGIRTRGRNIAGRNCPCPNGPRG